VAINIGQGTILKNASAAIAQVLEVDGPDVTVPAVDSSNLSSVVRAYRPGLPDSGKLTFTIQYDPAGATHTALTTAISAFPQALVVWTLLFNTVGGADSAAFSGFLTKFHPKGMNQDDNLEADVEIQASGAVTWS
jgi:hypothetical protein